MSSGATCMNSSAGWPMATGSPSDDHPEPSPASPTDKRNIGLCGDDGATRQLFISTIANEGAPRGRQFCFVSVLKGRFMRATIKVNCLPIGQYTCEFDGVEAVESEQWGPGWKWKFVVVSGRFRDRECCRFTGSAPSPKNPCGRFLAALAVVM